MKILIAEINREIKGLEKRRAELRRVSDILNGYQWCSQDDVSPRPPSKNTQQTGISLFHSGSKG